MLGNKHGTHALNITQFINGETTGQIDWGAIEWTENTMQNESA
jgi:hypothetical protein